MIGWLKGQVVDRHHPGKLVVDVNGVGYDVETSLQTFFNLDATTGDVGLHIHTIVREDALLLYGFLDKQERALFRALIKVNGVGPKMAITILSSISPDEFVQCIHQQNTTLLTKLPGIGKKTAERLVVLMKDSLQQLPPSNITEIKPIKGALEQDEAIKALESLGYRQQEAENAIKKIDPGQKTCEQLIRQALQMLSR
ncbi:MAG: Holliday junction branch migration protein RuvA [Legionellales bacterium]|nr:Holliday junction branch migration protein RuvA [Legionellales bacterium]